MAISIWHQINKLLYLGYLFPIGLKHSSKDSVFSQFELLVETLKVIIFNLIISISLAAVRYFMELLFMFN